MNRVYGHPSLSAALASILELEPGQVPAFAKVESGDLATAVAEFVRPFGLAYFEIQFVMSREVLDRVFGNLGYWILRGPGAASNEIKSVVMLGAKQAHDPEYTPGAEIVNWLPLLDDKLVNAGLFAPFDPMRVRRHACPETR